MTDAPDGAERRPNIVVILVDDMGYSDIGCFGGEIRTPNLDSLAAGGLRFSQMYNSARCCPSRAALLTGLHPQQAGVGHMVANLGVPQYQGYLRENAATLPEALKADGYATFMSGKWHVGGEYNLLEPDSWTPGTAEFPLPTQRGFDRYYGILAGAGNFYFPKTLMDQDSFVPLDALDDGFYLTDAIADNAAKMSGKRRGPTRPSSYIRRSPRPTGRSTRSKRTSRATKGSIAAGGTICGRPATKISKAWACWMKSGKSARETPTARRGRTRPTMIGKTSAWRFTPPR